MGQVGAFGGSRLGLVEAEGQRNLNEQLANIRATGYSQAYDKARDQFAGDRRYGLEGLAAQRAGGAEQRAIDERNAIEKKALPKVNRITRGDDDGY